jgi:hypothetical protein
LLSTQRGARFTLRIVAIAIGPLFATGPGDAPPVVPKAVPASPFGAKAAYVSIASAILLSVGSITLQLLRLNRLQESLALETKHTEQQHLETLQSKSAAQVAKRAREDAEFHDFLQNPLLVSGELAAQAHATEWRRLSHDPALAKTSVESVLLEMEKLGRDANVSAQQALHLVATLASPRASRIDVSKQGDAFVVRVAFRMSALSRDEKGAVTKHHTTDAMRREIERLSTRVIRDLFDYCGSRGIGKISVSCNHALRRAPIPPNATPAEREELLRNAPVVMANLYRASIERKSAATISNWRKAPYRTIRDIMLTEYDGLADLSISHDLMYNQWGSWKYLSASDTIEFQTLLAKDTYRQAKEDFDEKTQVLNAASESLSKWSRAQEHPR